MDVVVVVVDLAVAAVAVAVVVVVVVVVVVAAVAAVMVDMVDGAVMETGTVTLGTVTGLVDVVVADVDTEHVVGIAALLA